MTVEKRLLKPLPILPGPEETHRLIRQRMATLPKGSNTLGGRPVDQTPIPPIKPMTRTVEGNHGWKATLIGRLFERPSGIHIPYHLLSDILTPLCDWWEEAARDAVMDCPPPENVRYPPCGQRRKQPDDPDNKRRLRPVGHPGVRQQGLGQFTPPDGVHLQRQGKSQ